MQTHIFLIDASFSILVLCLWLILALPTMKPPSQRILASLAGILLLSEITARSADKLALGFQSPPASARPWVYWFPLDGNISSNGITLDLEAMKRVGIGGVLYMETDQ